MIEVHVYKILHGVYDERVTTELFNVTDQARTRGHSWKLAKDRSRLKIRSKFLHFKSSKCLEFING